MAARAAFAPFAAAAALLAFRAVVGLGLAPVGAGRLARFLARRVVVAFEAVRFGRRLLAAAGFR